MSNTLHPPGAHVVQTPPEVSLCAGCTSCEIVCTLVHEGYVSPSCSRVFLDRGTRSMIHSVLSCLHCLDHPCYERCPKKGKAMRVDERNIVYIDESECVGCGLCVKACVCDPPRINFDKVAKKAKKCDLCRTRPEGSACVEWCPVRCLKLEGSQNT